MTRGFSRRLWVAGGALAAAGVGYAWSLVAIQVIPNGSAAIIERFGRYSRTLGPGLNVIVPLVDTVRTRLDMREQTVPFPLRVVSVDDGTELPIELTVQYSVTDPVKAAYSVALYIAAIERHAVYELTYALSNLAAADARMSLQQVAESIRSVLEPRAQRWGLTLHEVLLTLGEAEVSDVQDEASVVAQHDGASAQVYASHVTMNVNGQITNQANGRIETMSNWKIERQEISGGNVQLGDHNRQNNPGLDDEAVRQARDVIAGLLAVLRAEQQAGRFTESSVITEAEVIQGELTAAEEEGRAPDTGLLSQTWHRMLAAAGPATGAVAGSATAALIGQLGQLIGA